MTSNEGLLRLKTIGSTALQILQQIDTRPRLATLEA